MLTLIIETSTEKGCLVIAENGTPLITRLLPGGPELSKRLALECKAAIHNLKNDAFSGAPQEKCKAAIHNPKNDAFLGAPQEKCKAALHLVAVGVGPGSYTGIRVGVALAKSLAYGWGVPLMGFCSLKGFGPGPVLVDARMGGFYALLDEKAELISPADPRLQKMARFSSPHPESIKKRLVTEAVGEEKGPDPSLLAQLVYHQFLEEGAPPFELNYLSSP